MNDILDTKAGLITLMLIGLLLSILTLFSGVHLSLVLHQETCAPRSNWEVTPPPFSPRPYGPMQFTYPFEREA